MTLLSVNVNKIALLRNARGEGNPNLISTALNIIRYGAHGITVHPRPDARHITYQDVRDLKQALSPNRIELNVEGYPSKDFLNLIAEVQPAQVTLVPDPPEALTSSFGWDVVQNKVMLTSVLAAIKEAGARSSLFIDPDFTAYDTLQDLAPDRVELYTYNYAKHAIQSPETATMDYAKTAESVHQLGIELNAGHDLNQHNLRLFLTHVPHIKEVSIGHALICEALEDGLKRTIESYLKALP